VIAVLSLALLVAAATAQSNIGICAFMCASDSQCGEGLQCCVNGCGGTNCMKTDNCKRGGPIAALRRAASPRVVLANCARLCDGDEECDSGRCCTNGCGGSQCC